MAEEPDRLSQLPDEVLQHILHLAPCREAVTTAVLSRRWRGLWPPPTGAVKIDIIPSGDNCVHEALIRAASHGPAVERLAIHVGVGCNNDAVDVVGNVISHHPAYRGVQDVRIRAGSDDDDSWPWIADWRGGELDFCFGSVPSAALRVLHMTNCRDLSSSPPSSFTFPCLQVLRLRRCKVAIDRLRDMVAASPQLAALQLECVCICDGRSPHYRDVHEYGRWDLVQRFCCPQVTTLVLLNCNCEQVDLDIELDVPRVQHFKYRGKIDQFRMRSLLPDVRRAYLHILDCYPSDWMCKSFWNFLKNFSGTKVLKLKLDWPIDYIAALERERIRELLIAGENQSAQSISSSIEHLEIDAQHNPECKDTGVAIGNLLQCFPALHELRLKLNTAGQHRLMTSRSIFLQSKAEMDFHRSIDHFRRHRDRPVVPFCGDDGKSEVSHIPGLSDRWYEFSCLRLHLKTVSLQFPMDKDNPNCVGVRLVKFFIDRGMALEKMYIDDGNMKLWEHMICKISGYPASPQPFSEYHVLARMRQALSMNQFSSSSKISRQVHPHKLEIRRTNPSSASRNLTILPLADA